MKPTKYLIPLALNKHDFSSTVLLTLETILDNMVYFMVYMIKPKETSTLHFGSVYLYMLIVFAVVFGPVKPATSHEATR